ncbi:hypothetical protein [Paractinoplanes toevensis]|uniref:Uncharacterized protein n=1 Tax=Paractinoplanes toevensis TaxID=571911 RepID=A0A919T4D7_9ACTN|nr:hypothetical protein [Actinoplanes toevensis]GIM89139.1 hypothetical protein Ato02nite_009320 [Actinoplanes toevensis]
METGSAAAATLWGVVARLRARGWHISLREIQRAQDVTAYLVARLGRPPTDDELRRHLQPIFCGRDRDLATFAEVFRDSLPAPAAGAASAAARRSWWRRIPPPLAGVAILLAVVLLVAVAGWFWNLVLAPTVPTGGGGTGNSADQADPRWTRQLWLSVAVLAVVIATASVLALRKRLRRRPPSPSLQPDLDLGWETAHPLDPDDGVRVARALRARTREPGRGTLDIRRTVDATIRAGIRLTPCFVEYKRAPEYLAVIEQRSAGDVLAGHYARMVDQLGAQGVGMRRTGLQPRSSLVLDPVRGPRHLESLQPASERERLLLFAPDWLLRDPLTGADRVWLDRFGQWAETIRIDPDVHRARPLRVVDRVLDDVRALDPAWARARNRPSAAASPLPSVFETGDLVWIEPLPPPREELLRVLEMLVTTLGSAGWYWLSASAVYPEISYELTVALGRLLHAEDGRPLSEHLPLEVLARLPWFRHAYMPDWLRASLIGTLSRGQLVEARAALDRALTSDSVAGLSVAESGPGAQPAELTDRVYLEGTSLRRRKLAAAAPKPLVAAIRRQRHRIAMPGLAADAPAPRVRRALVTSSALLVTLVLMTTIGIAVHAGLSLAGGSYDLVENWTSSYLWPSVAVYSSMAAMGVAAFTGAIAAAAGRRRGTLLGGGLSVLVLATLPVLTASTPNAAFTPVLVTEPILAVAWTASVLTRRFADVPVPWPAFQRRNRRVLTTALLVTLLAGALGFLGTRTESWPAALLDSDWGQAIAFCLAVGGFAIGFGGAYVGGVRIVPLTAGVVVAVTPVFNDIGDFITLLALPALLLLVVVVVLLRRYRDRPPPEFWETRWYEWKRPLLVGVPGVAGVLTWILSGGDLWLTAWFAGIPAVFAALNATADRIGAFVARNRLDVRFPLHLD